MEGVHIKHPAAMAGTFQFLFDLFGFVWYVALWFRVQIGLLWLYFNRRASHSADIKKATIKQCCRITIIGDGTYLFLCPAPCPARDTWRAAAGTSLGMF